MRANQTVINRYMQTIDANIIDLPPKTFTISVDDSNYIINNIVEWTISDKPFDDFIKLVQKDTRIYNNLLPFVWCMPRVISNHIYYLIFVIGKLAEHFKLNGLLYLICSPYFSKRDFDHNYIDFINKRFNENYKCNITGFTIIDTIKKKIYDNERIDLNKYNNINPADFINYCILTNGIVLFKKFLLFAEPNMIFHLNDTDNVVIRKRYQIKISKMVFWTVDYYAVIRQIYDTNEYNEEYNLLNNPLFNPNKTITDNYIEFFGEVDIKNKYYF